MAEEKIITINIRKELVETPRWRRSDAAIRLLKEKLKKMAKNDKVIIGKSINEKVWFRSIRKPPTKFRIKLTKEEKGLKAELLEK